MRCLIALSMLIVSAVAASAQSPASDAAAATPLVEFEMMTTVQQFIRP